MSKFCTNCGSTIEDNAGFCTVCGAPAPAEMPVQQPMQPVNPQSYQPMRQSAPQRNYATPDNAGAHPAPYTAPDAPGTSDSRSHLGLGIGITVAIVLLIAALITAVILTIFVWKPWDTGSSDASQKALIGLLHIISVFSGI